MDRLNGWQRIWVVLMVLWTLGVVVDNYEGPTYVEHDYDSSVKPPYAKMDYSVRKHMTTQWWEGANCEESPTSFGIRFEEVTDLPGLSVPVRLCFATSTADAERRRMDTIVGRMKAADEPQEAIDAVVELLKRRARERESRAFSTIVTPNQANAIKAEYARAYRVELDELRQRHYRETAQLWLIPPITLYMFGWTIGWIRQGFRRSRQAA